MSYWYHNFEGGIVVSSRVRLARNLADMPFPSRMSEETLKNLTDRVKTAVRESEEEFGFSLKFIEMDLVPENEIRAMVERHIISREFAKNHVGRAIALSDDESISIMIGEEDHIRIQVISAGGSLDKVYSIADRIDSILDKKLGFAYNSTLGYLTECPTNVGTGLRASVMLHLPFVEESKAIASITESVNKIGFTIRGMYGEGSSAMASLYQVSNQITLGISEKSSIENLKLITEQIVGREQNARNEMPIIRVEDAVCRALGTASFARLLDTEEFMHLISRIKLGIDMGIIKNEKLNPVELLINMGAGMLQSKFGEMEPNERDELRAREVRKALQNE